jgi:hypothetical protein
MPLIENDPALTVVVKMLCLTASLTFECACFVSCKQTHTFATSYFLNTQKAIVETPTKLVVGDQAILNT